MQNAKLRLSLMKEYFGVARFTPSQLIPEWAYQSEFYSITKTSEELSIVCSLNHIPQDVTCERDWRILKIEGPLDFSMIGILSSISGILAKQKVSIFAISTYDTDYILVKDKDIEVSIQALVEENYEIIR